MAKTREQILIDRYGFNRASYKWVLPGAEILKYIGQPVMHLEFTKDDEGKWNVETKKAVIKDISNFNPLLMTYQCFYFLGDDDTERQLDIVPEGFSFGNPDETGKMIRFIPYSSHCEMTERELFLNRVSELFDTRDTMSIDSLKMLQDSKEQDKTLKYCCNFGLAIKLEDGNVLWARIHKISINHKFGTKYSIRLTNDDDTWSYLVDRDDKEYDFENGLGKFKIIDLRTNDRKIEETKETSEQN